MIKASVLSFSILWCGVALAKDALMVPLVHESLLLDAAKGQQTVVVGERGHVLVGQPTSLEQVAAPTTATLTAVAAVGNKYWAVGHDATILMSSDGANNWRLISSDVELDRPFLDVTFLDQNQGFAVGGYGLFYRTNDGGNTWEAEQHASVLTEYDLEYLDSIKDDPEFYAEELSFILPHFNRINPDNERLLLAGETGLLAESYDLGQNWKRFDINYQGSFFDFKSLDNDYLIAVGLRGNMFVKKDGEDDDNWRPLATCVTTSLNTISVTEYGVFVAGNNGIILKIAPDELDNDGLNTPNSEGCQTHIAVNLIETDISSSISDVTGTDTGLLAVTATGIQKVNLQK